MKKCHWINKQAYFARFVMKRALSWNLWNIDFKYHKNHVHDQKTRNNLLLVIKYVIPVVKTDNFLNENQDQ